LAGMGVGKFVLGLIGDKDLGRYKERIVFFIALTLFLVLGPSLMLIIKIVSSDDIPNFVVYIQPILLIVAIALYSTSVSVHKIVNRQSELDKRSQDALEEGDAPSPLVIQPKSE
jgi:hypothetical protein